MGLEAITILLVLLVLGAKWFTIFHTARLRAHLVVATNTCRRNEQRYKALHEEREALAKQSKAVDNEMAGFESIGGELEEELYEVDQRNQEIRDQIDDRE